MFGRCTGFPRFFFAIPAAPFTGVPVSGPRIKINKNANNISPTRHLGYARSCSKPISLVSFSAKGTRNVSAWKSQRNLDGEFSRIHAKIGTIFRAGRINKTTAKQNKRTRHRRGLVFHSIRFFACFICISKWFTIPFLYGDIETFTYVPDRCFMKYILPFLCTLGCFPLNIETAMEGSILSGSSHYAGVLSYKECDIDRNIFSTKVLDIICIKSSALSTTPYQVFVRLQKTRKPFVKGTKIKDVEHAQYGTCSSFRDMTKEEQKSLKEFLQTGGMPFPTKTPSYEQWNANIFRTEASGFGTSIEVFHTEKATWLVLQSCSPS